MNLFNFGLGNGQPNRRPIGRKVPFLGPMTIVPGSDICQERDFRQIVYLERRRSERSSRPLCLVLAEGVGILETQEREMEIGRASCRERV